MLELHIQNKAKVEAEAKEFQESLENAPKATPEEIKQVLDEREHVAPEAELDPEAVRHLEGISKVGG